MRNLEILNQLNLLSVFQKQFLALCRVNLFIAKPILGIMNTMRYVILLLSLSLFLFSCGKNEGNAPSPGSGGGGGDTAPGDLVITNPITLSKVSNADLTIAGNCLSGATVFLAGGDTQNMTCVASSFSFTVSKSVGGTYFFNLYQSNSVGTSSTVTVSWLYDITAPAAIAITSPLSNPYTSGDGSISISGTCENGTTVNITGDHTASTTCAANAFVFTGITKGVDASYVFSLTQVDAATNTSSATSFTWIRDSSIPATPTISNFSDNPHYTKISPLNVQGVCVSGNTVTIVEGGVTLASGVCGGGNTYSLDVSKPGDGTYSLAVYQTDAVSLNDSAFRDFTWVYDTLAPAAPTIANPSTSPVTSSGSLIISGNCELNATVTLSGDDSQTQICSAGSYSFTISESVDGTYNYSLSQTDLATNTSASVSQQWIRDSGSLPVPVITTPSSDPFISNSTNLILSGTCQTGLTVQLSGVGASDVLSPAGSLTTTCASSSFSYTINKADGTYNLSVNQTNGVSTSESDTQVWTKDTIEPNTSITTSPPATNVSSTASFVFSADETSTLQCSLDGAAYSTCTSPLTYTNMTNGSHTLNIRATDTAGNVESSPASYTWTQSANSTIALYHFDAADPVLDSSNYGGALNNILTDNASSASATGKFNESRAMATAANFMYVADTGSQQAITSYLTLESWVNLTALPATYAPIVSKITTASSLASFEYGFRKQGAKYYMYFRGSLNGTSYTEVRSTSLSGAEQTALTSGYAHAAATFNLGTVKFYFNGAAKGTGTIGTVGSATLANSLSVMRIGYNGTQSLNGTVDEVRVSQIVRYNTGFTPSASAFTAD